MDFEKIILDLITPIVDDKENLKVEEETTMDDKEVILHVKANTNDVARLIGRRGIMASSIRQMMSVASRQEHKMIVVKFESL